MLQDDDSSEVSTSSEESGGSEYTEIETEEDTEEEDYVPMPKDKRAAKAKASTRDNEVTKSIAFLMM